MYTSSITSDTSDRKERRFMKTNRKLSKGMTLVEVLVSMTIFAVMAGVIFTVIMRANQNQNRNKMRDAELASEINIIGRKNDAMLNVTSPNSFSGDYKITFNVPGSTAKELDGVKVYETDEGEFADAFDFRMKTVVETASLSGMTITNLNENEYAFDFTNNLAEPITLVITINKGFIFEGTGRQYVHTGSTYTRTISSGSTINIGYYNDSYTDTDLSFELKSGISGSIIQGLSVKGKFTVGGAGIHADIRKAKLVVSQDGTNPIIKANIDYPHPVV